MFATLLGIVTNIYDHTITLEVSGVGFEVILPNTSVAKKENSLFLHTYLHWNQENGPTLYGFHSIPEKTVFLLIISCSGIGPKIGLAVLQHLEPANFLQAIIQEDIKTLSSISGIGTKKAEQMCVALKHKVAKLLQEQPNLTTGSNSLTAWKDLTETLTSLGYSLTEIKAAMNFLKESNLDETTQFSSVLRKTLAFLSKK